MKQNKGCGRILAISGYRDCGAYCPLCKLVHYCVFCGGEYELHRIELKKIAKDIKSKRRAKK